MRRVRRETQPGAPRPEPVEGGGGILRYAQPGFVAVQGATFN
jgi:hypothetical protein